MTADSFRCRSSRLPSTAAQLVLDVMANFICTLRWVLLPVLLLTSPGLFSNETLTPEPSSDSYNFVSHYRTTIHASVEQVWPVLIDLGAWMYEFELSTESGFPGTPGQILNLYQGQDFKVQVAGVELYKMLSVVNLPLTFQGEYGTGVGVMTLHESNNSTEVSVTMSRRYTSEVGLPNPLRERRASAEFQEQTRSMWQDRFLARLKQLVEESTHSN